MTGFLVLRLFILKLIKNNNSGQSITPVNSLCKNFDSRSKRRSFKEVRLRKFKTTL